jgi:hypothetical protein
MIFDMSIKRNDDGSFLNYDPAANELTVIHPGSWNENRFCPNQDKKFRFKIPSVEVTEV